MTRREEYLMHLRSDYWKEVRREVWKRDKGKCTKCGEPGENVHHLHYRYLFREKDVLDCVTLLCRPCHAAAHGHDDEPTMKQVQQQVAQWGRKADK
jgi:5-methylcytosine-specific restriction endonuclease McrA